jgi:hypothetical protein
MMKKILYTTKIDKNSGGISLKRTLKFNEHYTEKVPLHLQNFKKQKSKVSELKVNLWNAFVASDLSDILEQDCSIYPRILPGSYLPVINKTAKDITHAIMKLINLPEADIKAIFPEGPIRNFLINELKVIKYRPNRLVGSLRFDMAIVGEPASNNPPKLLEINEIGFDGLARMPFIHNTLFNEFPGLKSKYFSLDTSTAEIKNMRRLGKSLARFQTDCYNWDEECLLRRAQELKYDLRLITPTQLGLKVDLEDYPFINLDKVQVKNGQIKIGNDWVPESFMVSYALTLKDYAKTQDFYGKLVKEKVPHYGPFITGLFASKSILTILSEPLIRRKLLGSAHKLSEAILPAHLLSNVYEEALSNPEKFVIKHVDGFGGEQVFVDQELVNTIKKTRVSKRNEWVIQKRVNLNTIEIDGILSRPKKAIADLGVFVQYDWSNGKFNHFEVGGFLSRATNTSMKVNISSGGSQVGVMFTKKG